MIPIVDLKKQIAALRREIDSAVSGVIDSADFILGKEVRLFEEDVANYCRVKYAVGVSNGTDAIRLALVALGIKPNDEVICPAFTYYATAGAVSSVGAKPVFADIDPKTYCISIDEIDRIARKRKKIRAVIPVHLYGQCADMDNILRISRKHNLKIIEDAAQAFGACYKGKKAGSIGDCGAISFFPGKNLGAFGDAGMVLTKDKKTHDKLLVLRNQGNKERYYHIYQGFNHRMDSIQAAILRVKLSHLDYWNKIRQASAAYYNSQLKIPNVITPYVAGYTNHIYHQYVLRINKSSSSIIDYLRGKGIDARVYYPVPLHLQKCFKYLGYKNGDFPESEKAAKQTLAIPIYPELTAKEKEHIVSSVKEFFK